MVWGWPNVPPAVAATAMVLPFNDATAVTLRGRFIWSGQLVEDEP